MDKFLMSIFYNGCLLIFMIFILRGLSSQLHF